MLDKGTCKPRPGLCHAASSLFVFLSNYIEKVNIFCFQRFSSSSSLRIEPGDYCDIAVDYAYSHISDRNWVTPGMYVVEFFLVFVVSPQRRSEDVLR